MNRPKKKGRSLPGISWIRCYDSIISNRSRNPELDLMNLVLDSIPSNTENLLTAIEMGLNIQNNEDLGRYRFDSKLYIIRLSDALWEEVSSILAKKHILNE